MQHVHSCHLPALVYIDLRSEIHEFVGDMPEGMWFSDETLATYGNPATIADSAVDYVVSNIEDPESFMRVEAEHFYPMENEPWDVFYMRVLYRLSHELAPHLLSGMWLVHRFDLEAGVLRIEVKPSGVSPDARYVYPPRSH